MTHAPYEDWIFEEPDHLSVDQRAGLQAHLQSCASCQALAVSLGQVELRLRQAPQLAPTDGFAARWQVQLAERRLRHHRQALLALGLGLAALLALLALGLWAAAPYLTNLDASLWVGIYQMIGFYNFAQQVGLFFATLARAAFDVLPMIVWVFALGILCQLGVLWVVSFRLITNPRRVME
ncbi:MAG: hypothetical protein ACKOC5_11460 [Chloroflexota bacterium]